ncbi:MAG TPA: AEC family transporter [Candidatus Limnocylindrales bacterium]|nr:AEC family transporter [Candidatus Limnocylindrales bacterium]
MLAAFLPLWTITLLGWVAARFGWFEPAAQKALTSFAFHLAIPAVIFTTLAKLPLRELPLVPLAAFAVSTVVIFALAYLVGRALVKGERRERVVAAMASSYVNSGNLGIPVGFYVLQDVSLVVAVVAFQTVIVTPFIVAALDLSSNGWRRIAWLPLRVPVVSASLLGTLVTVVGLKLPDVVLRPLEILAGAAAPLALFALGMSLRGDSGAAPRRLAGTGHAPADSPAIPAAPPRVALHATELWRPELGMVTAAKLVLQPLVAYAAARWLFDLHGIDLIAVTIFAGLPTAQNTFVYATQYNVPNGLSRDAVLVTSILSLLSLSVILWLLSA